MKLSQKLQTQNDELKGKYPFKGYPTIVVLDPNGTELGRKVGYHPGSGPDAYISELEGATKKPQ
jgi:hypothetical protein